MRSLLLSIVFLWITFNNYAQLSRVTVDEVMNSELFNQLHPENDPLDPTNYPANSTTYRVYAELINPEVQVLSVFARNCFTMEISSENSFWNSPYGGVLGTDVDSEVNLLYPATEFDSFVTIGRPTSATPGGEISLASSPEGYWADESNAWLANTNGQDMNLNEVSWSSALGNENNTGVGPLNRVLLFQITTEQLPYFKLNIEVRLSNTSNYSYFYFSDAIPEEPSECVIGFDGWLTYGVARGTISIIGCMDESYCNYNHQAVFDDGSCANVDGCTYPEAVNFEAVATCNDGSCIIYGCTNEEACNYMSLANIEDGSCIMPDGCTYFLAENYDAEALCDDGSCIVLGCTNPDACNYWVWLNANTDDGSCIFPDGCTNDNAENYDANALCDDGSCIIFGCTNPDACNFNFGLSANTDDGSCILPDGCTDVSAVNFDLNALCDDNSCLYGGCTNQEACNYLVSADVDDGTCVTSGSLIYGVVYHDLFNNDLYDNFQFLQESTFSNWAILVEPSNEIIYTDADGNYNFHADSGVTYTLTLLDHSDAFDPKPNTQGVTVSGAITCGTQNLNLGILSTDGIYLQVSGPCCIFMLDIHCNNGMQPGLWVHNTGSLPLNGAVTMTYNPILQTEALGGQAMNPSSINPGETQWLIEGQSPGTQVLYQCQMLGPGVDYIGQVFPIFMNMSLENNFGYQVLNTTYLLEPTVVCAYDPNDKYSVPEGYAEPHYILEDDEIEYRIRFQNTGNFVAEDINIIDTLDVEHLDLSTFTPRYASHSFMTSYRIDEGIVDFQFENIMLPDSSADFDASMGYVVYSIKPKQEIEPNAVISNTAYIYFENNPPIVTNTTWHTIYDCNDLELLEGMELSATCANEELEVEITYPYVDSFVWSIDGSNQGQGSSIFQSEMGDPGTHTLGLTASNPLCSRFTEVNVDVLELPVASFTEDGALLSAADATAWQWYLNGQLIEGATNQTYLAENNGFYSVSLTNEADCSDLSDESFITVVGIEEFESNGVLIYPNPTSDVINVSFSTNNPDREIELVDVNGRSVIGRTIASGKITMLDCSALSAGNYFLRILENGVMQNSSSVLVK